MQTRRVVTALLVGVALGRLALPATAQSNQTFKLRLATVPIDFVDAAKVTGAGTGTAVLSGDKLTVTASFKDLRGPATTARVHLGRTKGVRGAAIGDLTVSKSAAGDVSGSLTLRREQIDALSAGRIYIQVNSEPAPEGNLWGWLLP